MEKSAAIYFIDEESKLRFQFINVDNWIMDNPNDIIFTNSKGRLIAPVAVFYGLDTGAMNDTDIECLNSFVLSSKKCYNSNDMRVHLCKYLNYFEKFYDQDKEYLSILSKLKYLIDYTKEYNKQMFFNDLWRYILSGSMLMKVERMVCDNYRLNLTYKNDKNPSLQYTDDHARILMKMSVLMDLIIPLLTHFAYMRRVENVDEYLLEMFDVVLHLFPVDMYSKLYETAYTNIKINEKNNQGIWDKQDIRGTDTVTHSLSSVKNIILNIMPKYTFDQNIISFNYASIRRNTGFQIVDIEYEYSYVPLSSSKRDEDNNSDFDKYEAYWVKQNEALYLQNKTNCSETMKSIELALGPFDREEIDFYMNELNKDGASYINSFQKQLVFNLFYKYFGDVQSINAINKEDYIKLVILPYIISGRVEKLISRKSVNKKELTKLQMSKVYSDINNKYKNEKIMKQILSLIATIISSDFTIIDYWNPELHGKRIEVFPDLICEEVLTYVMMC